MSVCLSNQELIPLLKINGNGWHVAFFEDQQTVSQEYLCENCNSVCCDPVELGCDHEDDDIYLFCNECLKDLIENNNSKCPLNSHSNPIIIANRTTRRKISKCIVNCPYSVRYQLQQMNNNKNNGKAQIYDTINNYNDEKEGANKKNDDCKINGCEWSGKLNDILTTNHLNQCVQKYDKSFVLKISLNKLQNEKIKLNQIINDQKQQINDKNRQTHELQQKNEKQSEQINKLNFELKQQSILVQDLMKMVEDKKKSDLDKADEVMEDMNEMNEAMSPPLHSLAADLAEIAALHELAPRIDVILQEKENKYDDAAIDKYKERFQETQEEKDGKEEMQHFLREVEQLNWELLAVDADGNSLYRCFAVAIYNDTTKHMDVRAECCKYMRENVRFFSHRIFDQRMKEKEKEKEQDYDHECGDNVDITALSELYNVRVWVFEYDSDQKKLYIAFEQGAYEETVNLPLILLARHRKKHYNIIMGYDPQAIHPLLTAAERNETVLLKELRLKEFMII